MTLNQIINLILGEKHPEIKRKYWENKKLRIKIPDSILMEVLDDNNNVIEDIYQFKMEDLESSDWIIIEKEEEKLF